MYKWKIYYGQMKHITSFTGYIYIYILGLDGVYMLPASNQTMGKSLNYMQVYSCYPKPKKQGKMLLPLEDGA